jgi:ABC-type methionine transport system permease subunit
VLYIVGLLPFTITPPVGLALTLGRVHGRVEPICRAVIFLPVLMAPVVAAIVTLMVSAGLTNINREYLEAAVMDGAASWQRLRFVIVPLLSPTLVFMLLLTMERILLAPAGYLTTRPHRRPGGLADVSLIGWRAVGSADGGGYRRHRANFACVRPVPTSVVEAFVRSGLR